jgi:rhamnose transport system permease protein
VNPRLARLATWEWFLGLLCIAIFVAAAVMIPTFLTSQNLSSAAANMAEKALLALPLALLVIAREIDLSIASNLALCSVVLGLLVQAGLPLPIAIPAVLAAGCVAGVFNGWLVVRIGLPSLVVTLGTLALFRGLGYVLMGTGSVSIFPPALTNFGVDMVPGTPIPWTIVPFLLLAPVFGVVLHLTATGRRIYAIGGNPDTALYSGIRVHRIRFELFLVSGLVSALAAIVYTARVSNARADNALGFELDVITIVLLGGVSVLGGRGRIDGVCWAIVLIALVRDILGLLQIGGDAQGTVVGLLLIVSILVANLARRVSRELESRRPLGGGTSQEAASQGSVP